MEEVIAAGEHEEVEGAEPDAAVVERLPCALRELCLVEYAEAQPARQRLKDVQHAVDTRDSADTHAKRITSLDYGLL